MPRGATPLSETPTIQIIFTAPADEGVAEAISRLERVAVEEHAALGPEGLLEAARRADILVTRSFQRVSRAVLEAGAAKGLQAVVQASAGLDNIDAFAAAEFGIDIEAVDPGNAVSVAELVLLSLLALVRHACAHWQATSQGVWPERDRLLDHELRGKRLGLVGLGRTGSQVARRASAFEMELWAHDPYLAPEVFSRLGVRRARSLPELLARLDALSLHCPLTDETRGLIGSTELALLPRGAILVNASRGEILDERALAVALDEGRLAGAALDVFSTEPPGRRSIVSHPRVLATPHLGGHTVESHLARGHSLRVALGEIIARLMS